MNSTVSRSISHTTVVEDSSFDEINKVSRWMRYNEQVFPPQDPSEPPRPAYVCHEVKNVKYSPKKMWYMACFVRGMSVDEALKQLQCLKTKGSIIIKEAIEEAIEIGINDHNVEFRSNLWVAESFCGKGVVIKGIRRNAKGRITVIRYRYCNYYLRLEEGLPPEDYYCKNHLKSGPKLLDQWFTSIRSRKIHNSLHEAKSKTRQPNVPPAGGDLGERDSRIRIIRFEDLNHSIRDDCTSTSAAATALLHQNQQQEQRQRARSVLLCLFPRCSVVSNSLLTIVPVTVSS
ncbi:hypothetical protein V9T40_013663 [Parthenolecanium corni]|uniref:Large ribosomal subunit protein uL22m n=1 Tax=Parthenolecanium corni TaxID=536013 RepID=A0AAN9Y2P2_9HEMI